MYYFLYGRPLRGVQWEMSSLTFILSASSISGENVYLALPHLSVSQHSRYIFKGGNVLLEITTKAKKNYTLLDDDIQHALTPPFARHGMEVK